MIRGNANATKLGPRAEPRVLKKGPLAPSEDDRRAFANFLRQPDTGLVKLVPQTVSTTREADRITSRATGGGYRYSLSFLSHDYVGEISLERAALCLKGSVVVNCLQSRNLVAGGFGILANLGKQSLVDLIIDDARARFMLSYVPARTQPQAFCDAIKFRRGVTVDNQFYRDRLPIEAGSTYLLRAIDYGQSDVLAAFQLVREDSDGSVTLAWKLLKRLERPHKLENVLYLNLPDKCPIK